MTTLVTYLGLEVVRWPFHPSGSRYAVIDDTIFVSRALSTDDHRWAVACAIGHWLLYPWRREYQVRLGPWKRLYLLHDVAMFAFNVLVPSEETWHPNWTSHEIAETFGLPVDIVAAYKSKRLETVAAGKGPYLTAATWRSNLE